MPYFFGLFADEACRGAGAREEKRVKQSEVEAISLPPHTDVEKLLWIDQRVSSYPDHQTLCPNARREKEERHFISALYLLTPLKRLIFGHFTSFRPAISADSRIWEQRYVLTNSN
ncbi:hypothetical protein F2P81_018712 [Scophthalmus maximus]|uniref:Uncharacterized protein n=1 Tax=Scophthalmus maximus TaxID=52904 RepID=A0A6A4S8W9_SCOMX|nr:hypothetical protein F2P81_018712 [Scophthalmus maximus]